MAIDNNDRLVRAVNLHQPLQIDKQSLANQTVGQLTSLWRATGRPAQAAIPSGPVVCTKDTLGAFPFNNPPLGDLSNIGGLQISGTLSHHFLVWDRLTHRGGLSGVTTIAQTVGLSIPPDRNAAIDGSDSQWYIEIYTDIGATAVTATVAYTDQTDTARTTTISIGGVAFNRAGRLSRIFPNPGQEIKTITSITHATTGVAGNYGITCGRRLLSQPMGQPIIGVSLDYAQVHMPRVPNDACLWAGVISTATTTGDIRGVIPLYQG